MTQTQLFFGRGNVTDAAWHSFQKSVITEHFDTGFTVVDTDGSWKDSMGIIQDERGKLVIRLHNGTQSDEASVREVINSYKEQFNQQSVLRVDTPTCATF